MKTTKSVGYNIFSYRFFGKGLDIDVDVSSVVLVGGRLDVTLEVPEREGDVTINLGQVEHLA